MADVVIRGIDQNQIDLTVHAKYEVMVLPEGHGRLVDADAPVRVVWHDGTIHSTTVSRLLCKHSLLDLPKTIVPSEGGGEE